MSYSENTSDLEDEQQVQNPLMAPEPVDVPDMSSSENSSDLEDEQSI